jgi:putative transposase
MVRDAKAWPWNSYLATAGYSQPSAWLTTEWLLVSFGKKKTAMTQYRDFVAAGKKQLRPGSY